MKPSGTRTSIQVLGLTLFLLPIIQVDALAWEKGGLRLRGRMQVRWNVEREVTPDYDMPEENRPQVETGEWVNHFSLRRARIDGRWEPKHWIRLMLEFDLADGMDPKDIYARLEFLPLIRIQAGQFKKPFSRLKMSSPFDLVIPERGLMDRFVIRDTQYGGYGGRDIGVMLSGVWEGPVKLRYYLGAFNNPLSDEFYHRDYVARFQVRLIKGLILAVNASHKLYNQKVEFGTGGQAWFVKRTGNLFGADLRWTIGDFRLQLEGAFGDNLGTDPDERAVSVKNGWGNSLYGLHAIASYSYKLRDWITLEPAFMAEMFDPDDQAEGQALRLAGAVNVHLGNSVRVTLYGEGLLDDSAAYDTPTTVFVQLELRL